MGDDCCGESIGLEELVDRGWPVRHCRCWDLRLDCSKVYLCCGTFYQAQRQGIFSITENSSKNLEFI